MRRLVPASDPPDSDAVNSPGLEGKTMDPVEIKEMVRARYGSIAAGTGAVSSTTSCCGTANAPSADSKSRQMGYAADQLAAVPEGANLGLGCGNPQAIA